MTEERNLHESERFTKLNFFLQLENTKFKLFISRVTPKDLYLFEKYGEELIEIDDFEAILFDENHIDFHQNNCDLDDWLD